MSARVTGDQLGISIENTAPSPTQPRDGTADGGLGIANVCQRLAVLYGDRQRVITTVLPGTFRVDITLPFVAAVSTPADAPDTVVSAREP